jgi:hypothetical protein
MCHANMTPSHRDVHGYANATRSIKIHAFTFAIQRHSSVQAKCYFSVLTKGHKSRSSNSSNVWWRLAARLYIRPKRALIHHRPNLLNVAVIKKALWSDLLINEIIIDGGIIGKQVIIV